MLIVSAPLKTDMVCAALDGYDKDGVTMKLASRKGMELRFDVRSRRRQISSASEPTT